MDKQKENLKARIEVAVRIGKNAVMQKQAIKDNDTRLLGKLLKRQKGNIDRLSKLYRSVNLIAEEEMDEESERQEEALNLLINEAIQQNTENIASAEALKISIGRSLYNLKVSGHAIRNGYFGGVQPRRGRYFDRKK